MVLNVRQKQKDAIIRVLSLSNTTLSTAQSKENESYKVLILDNYTKDIIAPLMRVNDLRQHGVTLHLILEMERERIPETSVVYLLSGNEDSVKGLLKDAEAGLYDEMYVNFAFQLPRALLEQLAQGAVKVNQVEKFKRIFDQYVGFISLEGSLFSLGLKTCYVELNDNTAKDDQITAMVNKVVDGLLSVSATLGVVPIIRCPGGGLADHVAQRLNQKLKDHLKLRNSIFQEQGGPLGASISRPLLILFDRNFELPAALQHTWSYKPLVQDVLGMKLNRIEVADSEQKMFDVDDEDFFWQAHGTKAFPEIAQEVDAALGEYTKAMKKINQGATSQQKDYVGDDDLQQNTKDLMSAVSSLPELTARKRVIDKHTNLATALLNQIKSRKLDEYYNLEEDLLAGKADFQKVSKQLQSSAGSASDKLRLALVYLLVTEEVPSQEQLQEIESALSASGANLASFSYVQRLRRMNLTGAKSHPNLAAASATVANRSDLLNWADKTFQQGFSVMTKGVKNLLSGQRQSGITSAVRLLLESKDEATAEAQFAFYDPKSKDTKPKPGSQFKEAIVFVIGGGNYLERESLQMWASRSQPPRNIVYGATDLLSGEEFLKQLEELGQKSGI